MSASPATARTAIRFDGVTLGYGRHPAVQGQLFIPLEGRVEVTGGDGASAAVGPGQAVWWEAGEEHETVSPDGAVALIIEGPLHERAPWER